MAFSRKIKYAINQIKYREAKKITIYKTGLKRYHHHENGIKKIRICEAQSTDVWMCVVHENQRAIDQNYSYQL